MIRSPRIPSWIVASDNVSTTGSHAYRFKAQDSPRERNQEIKEGMKQSHHHQAGERHHDPQSPCLASQSQASEQEKTGPGGDAPKDPAE